ncbi:MAG: hypothetical protein A4E73_01356 [Syntrophaceae bacterium PtaU1.Bin231]|nr:MAG: hypothetical protein A4E73_01356 [Syntrophaceae bacterium PtaU1.Bin231]
MTSGSRSSPTTITSGSSRRTSVSPFSKEGMCVPSSRCSTKDCFEMNRYSMGSSRVTIWAARLRLISSMMAAIVVDLPVPVAPQISTRPERSSAICCSEGWRLRRWIVGMTPGSRRMARLSPRVALKTLSRSRTCWIVTARSTDHSLRRICICRGVSSLRTSASTSAWVHLMERSCWIWPFFRNTTGCAPVM